MLDEQRIREICQREQPRLVGLVALHVGDRYVAEELVQEAFIQFCLRWRDVERPEAWLTRVATNLANSWLRRRIAERRANRRHAREREVPDEADAAAVLSLRAAVSRLPRRQRTAVVLRYYEQMTVAETARYMRCAEGTVKSLTNRALTSLASVESFSSEAMNRA